MACRGSRREFLLGIGAVAAATAGSAVRGEALWAAAPLYPPMDLSYFDTPISAAAGEMHIGYASITWGGKDRQAVQDIGDLGFQGIQVRANVIHDFASAAELRELLERHKLKMVALSSGGVRIDPAFE